jgi:hypothetical protein
MVHRHGEKIYYCHLEYKLKQTLLEATKSGQKGKPRQVQAVP